MTNSRKFAGKGTGKGKEIEEERGGATNKDKDEDEKKKTEEATAAADRTWMLEMMRIGATAAAPGARCGQVLSAHMGSDDRYTVRTDARWRHGWNCSGREGQPRRRLD